MLDLNGLELNGLELQRKVCVHAVTMQSNSVQRISIVS